MSNDAFVGSIINFSDQMTKLETNNENPNLTSMDDDLTLLDQSLKKGFQNMFVSIEVFILGKYMVYFCPSIL